MRKIFPILLPFLWQNCLANNIASSGIGIIGTHTVIDTTLGIPYVRGDQPDGSTVRITDGVYGTNGNFDAVLDTWNGATDASDTFAYYGVTGLTMPAGQEVTNVTVNLITANDGGWFGPNGIGPGDNNALDASHLTVPTIQVTTNAGTTWRNINSTNNTYNSTLVGHTVGAPGNAGGPTYATVSFDLDIPQSTIDGIRLIGPEGGGPAGGDLGGFIGLTEFEINTTTIKPGADLDNDGIPDVWETLHGVDDPGEDVEPDGLTNLEEYQNSTLPKTADTDGDGLNDGHEVNTHLSDPLIDDSDSDGLTDGDEVNTHLTDPNKTDSDLDGLEDGDEVNTHMTNPNLADTDGDGLSDSFEIANGSNPNLASSVPSNIALGATGIAGNHNEVNDLTTLGLPYTHHGNGVLTDGSSERLTDGNTEGITLETIVDTWHNGTADTHSYAGVIWDLSSPPSEPVNSIALTLATFVDGGWFGINGTTPAGNSPLELNTHISSDSLPEVQVTRDEGDSWNTVPSTTDYLDVMTGHIIGNPPTTAKVVWNLNTAQSGINGIRVIGTHGGLAGDAANGFIGVTEVAVTTGSISLEVTNISFSPPPAGNSNGQFILTWSSSPGNTYSIIRSSDLTSSSWIEVDDSVPSGGSSTTHTFEHPVPGAEKLFFRISKN